MSEDSESVHLGRIGCTFRKTPVAAGLIGLAATLAAVGLVAATRPAQAAFPGKAGKIAFTSSRDGNDEIYVMNADGSGQTDISNSPSTTDREPEWSPDGTKIVYLSAPVGSGPAQIWTMNAGGSNQTQLTNSSVHKVGPAWTADGRIVFSEPFGVGSSDIYILNADGSGVTNLTNNPAIDWRPGTSPRGDKIAFFSNRDGPVGAIYMMRDDGSHVTRVTNGPVDFMPNWSSNGNDLVFVRFDPTSTSNTSNDIFVAHTNGQQEIRLTNTPAQDEFKPAWSPDGKRIVFDGSLQIYVMNADGSGVTQLTSVGDNQRPDWQPVS